MYILYHILVRHAILMLCLNLMLGPTYLPYFFWQPTGTTHIFHLGLTSGARYLIFGSIYLHLLPYCVQAAKALARLHKCAGSPEASLLADAGLPLNNHFRIP